MHDRSLIELVDAYERYGAIGVLRRINLRVGEGRVYIDTWEIWS